MSQDKEKKQALWGTFCTACLAALLPYISLPTPTRHAMPVSLPLGRKGLWAVLTLCSHWENCHLYLLKKNTWGTQAAEKGFAATAQKEQFKTGEGCLLFLLTGWQAWHSPWGETLGKMLFCFLFTFCKTTHFPALQEKNGKYYSQAFLAVSLPLPPLPSCMHAWRQTMSSVCFQACTPLEKGNVPELLLVVVALCLTLPPCQKSGRDVVLAKAKGGTNRRAARKIPPSLPSLSLSSRHALLSARTPLLIFCALTRAPR